MFGNLIESGSHGKDHKRQGKFLLGTLVFYSLLLVAAGVGSIYAYHVRLDDRNQLELLTMMRFPVMPVKSEPERRPAPRPIVSGGSPRARSVTVPEVARLTPYNDNRQVAREDTPVLARDVPYQIGPTTVIPPEIGTPGDGKDTHNNIGGGRSDGDAPVVEMSDEAPVHKPVDPPTKVEMPPQMVRLPSNVISGKAISKPAPAYPQLAKMAHVSGTIAVQIVIDERGRVISAQATSGHPLLLQAAVQAASRAQFSPTLLSGQPVKVSGIIYYNFVLQ